MKAIYLIRHGETTWARDGKHTGLTDLPLTAVGMQQAKKIGARLKPLRLARVYASPLKRALETSVIAGFKAEIDRDLVEWDYGQYEGLTSEQIEAKVPGWNLFDDGVKGGETLAQVATRADRFLQKIAGDHGSSAVFSSGHFLRILAARWISLEPFCGKLFRLAPGSVSILGYERESMHRGNQKSVNGNVGASGLQQAQPLAKQAMCKHMVDAASCKNEDADEASSRFLNPDVDKVIVLWNDICHLDITE